MSMISAPRRTLALIAVAALVVTGTACGSDNDDGSSPATTTRDAASGTTSSTASATTEATATTIEAPTTESSDPSPTTATTDAPAPVTLRFDGVGPTSIGQPADTTIEILSGALGEPSEVRDWVQPSCELAGPGSEGARSVMWGGLIVSFRGPTPGDATFAGWTYTGGPAGTAAELRLDSGVGIGSPGDDLAEVYGADAGFVPFEMFDAHWEVTQAGGTLWATVGGDAAGAPISRMDLNPSLCE